MSATCNAEYNESGNYDKHTHHCLRQAPHSLDAAAAWSDKHLCACGSYWSDKPVKPESRCTFEQWWASDGRFIDPDTDDVPWFYKRKELAGLAFEAARLNQDAEIQRLTEERDEAVADATFRFAQHQSSEIQRLTNAIRKHRDEKGDDRCWLDDAELYAVLPEGPQAVTFCEPAEMLENCRRYIAKRHDKEQPYVSPQREIQRLTQELAGSKDAYVVSVESNLTMQSEHSKEIIRLTDALKVAVEVLERYGWHEKDCTFNQTPWVTQAVCSCGYEQARAAIDAMEGERT